MTDHTRTEKIGGDSIYFCGLPSRAGNRYDRVLLPGFVGGLRWLKWMLAEVREREKKRERGGKESKGERKKKEKKWRERERKKKMGFGFWNPNL